MNANELRSAGFNDDEIKSYLGNAGFDEKEISTFIGEKPKATPGRILGGLWEELKHSPSAMASSRAASIEHAPETSPDEKVLMNWERLFTPMERQKQGEMVSGLVASGTPHKEAWKQSILEIQKGRSKKPETVEASFKEQAGLLSADSEERKKSAEVAVKFWRGIAEMPALQRSEEYEGKSSGWLEDLARAIGGTAPSMAGLALNPVVGIPMMYDYMKGTKYEELAPKIGPERAEKAAAMSAAAQIPLEAMSGMFIIKKALGGGRPWVKYLTDTIGASMGEGATEFVQQYPDEVATIWAMNPDLSGKELTQEIRKKLPEMTKEAAYAGSIGMAMGGLFSGTASVAQGSHDAYVSAKQKKINEQRQKELDALEVENNADQAKALTEQSDQIKKAFESGEASLDDIKDLRLKLGEANPLSAVLDEIITENAPKVHQNIAAGMDAVASKKPYEGPTPIIGEQPKTERPRLFDKAREARRKPGFLRTAGDIAALRESERSMEQRGQGIILPDVESKPRESTPYPKRSLFMTRKRKEEPIPTGQMEGEVQVEYKPLFAKSGKPYKTEAMARKAAAKTGGAVVQVEGGYAVQDRPKTITRDAETVGDIPGAVQPQVKAGAKTIPILQQPIREMDMQSEATRLGLEYAGVQEGGKVPLHLFTDPQNGSTFTVREGESVDAALKGNRERFAPKTPVGETGDTTVQPKAEEATGGGKEQAAGVLEGEKEPDLIETEYDKEMQRLGVKTMLEVDPKSDDFKRISALRKNIGKEIIDQYGKKYPGEPIALLSGSKDRGVLIAPSAKTPGKIQATYFDDRGFSGDTQYENMEKAAADSFTEGYRYFGKELFEKYVTSNKFHDSMAETQRIQRIHEKRMKAVRGTTGKAFTDGNTEVGFRYAVYDIDDLRTSHSDNGNQNPDFPKELQPRDRERITSINQIENILSKLNPSRLGENSMVTDGAPVIGPDLIVESGNGRTIALRKGYKASHKNLEKYKTWLSENAEKFGLSKEGIAKIKSPVLVRERTGDIDREAFVKEANKGTAAAMGAVETAASDAKAIFDAGILSSLEVLEDGEIISAKNVPIIQRILGLTTSPAELGRFVDKKGNLSRDGLLKVNDIIFAVAYGDTSALEIKAELTDDESRNITRGLSMAAPALARAKSKMAVGSLIQADITPEISKAADKYRSIKEEGMTVEQYLSQEDMFTDARDPLVDELLNFFNTFKRSGKRIGIGLTRYAQIWEEVGLEGSLFSDGKPPTKGDILARAIKEAQDGGETGKTPMASLFEGEPGKVRSAQKDEGKRQKETPAPVEEVTPQKKTLFRKKAKAEKAVTEISVDSETLTKGILSRMNRTLKSMGYDVRGADDIKMLLDRRMLRNGKLWHEDWIRAYQQAIEGAELAKARKAQKSERKHIDRSRLRELGYTNDPREAGYITPIGKLIDLSGKREGGQPGTRSYDHREAGGTLGMQEFMDEGSIRMDYRAGSFDIVAMPTSAQLKIVRKIAAEKNGEITLDLWEGLGEQRESYYLEPSRVLSVQYREGTKPSKIINDIKTFYAGEMPSKTLFRKSDPTNTPAFKKWFGNSKVVDENGKPLVVYHGTDTPGFLIFKKSRQRGMGGPLGFWFASKKEATEPFSHQRYADQEGGVYEVYLSIHKPMEYHGWKEFTDHVDKLRKGKSIEDGVRSLRNGLIRRGFDGVVIKSSDTDGGIVRDDWVAFYPTQIKSINNQGTFDPENPNILMRKGKPSGIPIPAVNRSIEPILSKWMGAPKIVVTNSKDTKIPKGLMRQMGDAEGVAGAFYEDTVYLFHDNIDSIEDAQKTILHESAHWGPRRMFGRSFDRFLRGVLRSADKGVLDKVAKLYDCDMTKVPDRMLAAEEYVAHISETGQDAKTWNRFTSYVKQWLIKRGFTVKLSDDEIRAIVSRGREGTGTVFTKDGRMRAAAYHGSPHTFDKFSTDYIGTGEGAQAYGYGLYFAGREEVGEYYRDALGGAAKIITEFNGRRRKLDTAKILEKIKKKYGDELASEVDERLRMIATKETSLEEEKKYAMMQASRSKYERDVYLWIFRDAVGLENSGHLYEVELAPDDDEYLLWDKPLSEQSEKVKAAVNTYFDMELVPKSDPTGREIYKYFSADTSDIQASEDLRSLGIRGIKYLDGTSRGKGEGAYNYVIFSDEDVEIKARFRKVTDPALLSRLKSGKTIKVYRAMQVIDGKLYPPMSASIGGKLRTPTEIGAWEQAVESPKLADDKGRFKLEKGNKKSITARYNPYFHTSRSPLNDQFSEAYNRPNLVTVEVEVPVSELTSGYRAENAKDAVGEMAWHSGPVSSKLPASKARKVILSRYAKVVRIVPDSEVAEHVAELLRGEDIAVPEHVITPSLKRELLKRGVNVMPRQARFRKKSLFDKKDSATKDAVTSKKGPGDKTTEATPQPDGGKYDIRKIINGEWAVFDPESGDLLDAFKTEKEAREYQPKPKDKSSKSNEYSGIIQIYRGEHSGNKGGSYYSPNREWVRQFTQSGQDKEISSVYIDASRIYKKDPLPSASSESDFDAAVREAREKGYPAVWFDEGRGEPNSIYVIDKKSLSKNHPNQSRPSEKGGSAKFRKKEDLSWADSFIKDNMPGVEPINQGQIKDELSNAVKSTGTVSFTYTKDDGESGARTIKPLLVYEANGHTYIKGHDLEKLEDRTFRIDRMSSVTISTPVQPLPVTKRGRSLFDTRAGRFGKEIAQAIMIRPVKTLEKDAPKASAAPVRKYRQTIQDDRRMASGWMAQLEDAVKSEGQNLTRRDKAWMKDHFKDFYEHGKAMPNERIQRFADEWTAIHNAIGDMAKDLGVKEKYRTSEYVVKDGNRSVRVLNTRKEAEEFIKGHKKAETLTITSRDAMRFRPFTKISKYFPHILTPDAREALRTQRGELFDALVEAARTKGFDLTPYLEDVDIKNLVRRNANLEHARQANMPEYVVTPSGRVQVLEVDPLKVIPGSIEAAARRLAFVKNWGPVTSDSLKAHEAHRNAIAKEAGSETAYIWDYLWQDMQGRSRDEFLESMGSTLQRTFNAGEAIARSLMLSTAQISNIVAGPVPIMVKFGTRRVAKNYTKLAARYFLSHFGVRMPQTEAMLEDLRRRGAWAHDTQKVTGDTENLSHSIGGMADTFLKKTGMEAANRFLNKVTSFSAHSALFDAVDGLKAPDNSGFRRMWGEDHKGLRSFLKREGEWTDADIDRMIKDGITDNDVTRFVQRASTGTNVFMERAETRPQFMKNGFWRRVFAYTSFYRTMGAVVSDTMRYAKEGNYRPLITLLLGAAVLGTAEDKIKDYLKGVIDMDKKESKGENFAMNLLDALAGSGALAMPGTFINDIRWWTRKGDTPFTMPQVQWWGNVVHGMYNAVKKGLEEGPGEGAKRAYYTTIRNIPIFRIMDNMAGGPYTQYLDQRYRRDSRERPRRSDRRDRARREDR